MASDEKLQKYVSACGLMSRRAAEAAIREGQFAVNGRVALLGDRIDPRKDVVTYRGEPLTPSRRRKICLLLNKPAGVLATRSDEHGRRTVVDLARENGYDGYLYPVGRLDKDSEGLLLLTDVGLPGISGRELADRVRERHPGTAVLFVTGYAENAQDRQAFLGERMDLLLKPFNLNELLRAVRQKLG